MPLKTALQLQLDMMLEAQQMYPMLAQSFVPMIKNIEAQIEGRTPRTLDWVKLVEIIAERQPESVCVGMSEDWFWTGKEVYVKGEPLKVASVTTSNWATPVVRINDDEEIECWREVTQGEDPIDWPDEAVAMLIRAGLMEKANG